MKAFFLLLNTHTGYSVGLNFHPYIVATQLHNISFYPYVFNIKFAIIVTLNKWPLDYKQATDSESLKHPPGLPDCFCPT